VRPVGCEVAAPLQLDFEGGPNLHEVLA
jgi:hypothetical protein